MAPARDDDRDRKVATWAARLSDGELDPQGESEFIAWLDEDPENGAQLEELVASWKIFESFAAAPEIVTLRRDSLASVHAAQMRGLRRASRWSWRRPVAAGLAASIAAVLLVLVGTGWNFRAPATYETGVGERRLVRLADGSTAFLDGASRLQVRYSNGRRAVWLERGRAKFDVRSNPLKPFIVTANDNDVVATGTSFTVERLAGELHVALYRGKVSVVEKPAEPSGLFGFGSEDRPGQEHILKPGHELIAAETGARAARIVALSEGEMARSLSWESGQITFANEPLATAVERINRYAQPPLRLGDAAVGRVRISGVVESQDIGNFIEGLQVAFGVRAVPRGDRIDLYSY